jgi:hypothetical protein
MLLRMNLINDPVDCTWPNLPILKSFAMLSGKKNKIEPAGEELVCPLN